MLCYLVCVNHKWLLARPHTINNEISGGKLKNTQGDCLCCFLLGMFLLCGIEDSLKQHGMKKEATDRRLQACFREAEACTAPLSTGEVSNGPLLTSNVFTAGTSSHSGNLPV